MIGLLGVGVGLAVVVPLANELLGGFRVAAAGAAAGSGFVGGLFSSVLGGVDSFIPPISESLASNLINAERWVNYWFGFNVCYVSIRVFFSLLAVSIGVSLVKFVISLGSKVAGSL